MRRRAVVQVIRRHRMNIGRCDICDGPTMFVELGPWLRDDYLCVRCRSIPRWRLTMRVLQERFPRWRELELFEAAPGGALSDRLRAECRSYTSTHYGSEGGEDLQCLSFADLRFDVVVTQDVMEHVLDPAAAFAEIARILRPGGAHIFTTPRHEGATVVRARASGGVVEHLLPDEYHVDPSTGRGALVVTDWGDDTTDLIETWSGLSTEVVQLQDRRLGLDGEFLEVFVTRRRLS